MHAPATEPFAETAGPASLPWDSVSSDGDQPEEQLVPLPAPEPEAPCASSAPSEPFTHSDLDSEAEELDAPIPAPASGRASRSNVGGGGGFTIPLMCIGIGLIAMCLLIPATDDVHKLAYERERLKADLAQLHKQVDTNAAFLKRVGDDPMLAERLARRQLKMVPVGSQVLNLKSIKPQPDEMSPFLLVTVPPPAQMPPYQPIGGFLAGICRNPQTQLYLIGASLMMIGSSLVLSRSSGAGKALEK
jgi:hypothetical protein